MDRRNFFKYLGLTGTAMAAGCNASANTPAKEGAKEFNAVLVDTTRCIGCRNCERTCSLEHNLNVPDVINDNALEKERTTSEKQWTVVNRYQKGEREVFIKAQCMHCWQPACAAACLTNALYKTEEGPVIWRSGKCMGCRYCMVSCPYSIPKFEYYSWNPKIQKCNMCWERLIEGKKPACVEACPTDALMYGQKKELMEIARVRIYSHPTKYHHKIYGEHDAGGTGWLYISSEPFETTAFKKDVGTTPYPEYTRDFLYNVPIILFGFPALMFGLSKLSEIRETDKE